MQRWQRCVVLLGLALGGGACSAEPGPAVTWSADELAFASRAFGMDEPTTVTLRSYPVDPKRHARGYDTTLHRERLSDDEPFDPVFSSIHEQRLHETFCTSEAVVLARAGGSAGAIATDRFGILTKTSFVVVDELQGGPAFAPGATVNVVRRGGEAEDHGERFFVEDVGVDDFRAGSLYLLALRPLRRGGERHPTLFEAPRDHVRVAADRLAVETPDHRWLSLHTGDSYNAQRQRLATIGGLSRCWGRQP